MKINKLVIALGLIVGAPVFAHEGHGIPGALPPAPHGGVVQEAEHTGKDLHAGQKEETELFFEVVYKDKQISVFPLVLPPSNSTAFVAISPKKELTKVVMKTEFPRAKKVEAVVPTIEDDAIRVAFDSKGANRFIVHIAAEHNKETKVAKIQIEKR